MMPNRGADVRKPINMGGLRGLPDILAPGLPVIFCGINPGATAALAGRHFVSRTNRFWRVLHRAGFTPQEIDPEDDRSILRHGCGLTVAVARPTPGANDLSRLELKRAGAALKRKIRRYDPRVVAFLGKPAFAAITGNNAVSWGRQPELFGGAVAWVLPNPSGRNLNFSFEALVLAYSELKAALGPIAADVNAKASRQALPATAASTACPD
ncbi:uracil-DNA glycosylase superfamily protein [Rhodoplanes sp. Z2-YC6860]|nr:uracil-DNA glycosylase superfamily protein [Rhodoplanes sp. Z2-YC6860]